MFANMNKFSLSDDERRILRQKILAKTISDSDIAMKRYGDYDLEKIGVGSDRRVYNLEDEFALKVAKRKRGLMQNEEGDYSLEFVPDVEERGLDYVVAEKADRDDERSRVFLKPLKEFGHVQSDPRSNEETKRLHEFHDVLHEVDDEYGTDLAYLPASYNFAYGDLIAARNWGWRDDMPKLVDSATVHPNVVEYIGLENEAASGDLTGHKKEVFDEYMVDLSKDWASVLQKRRAARKEGYVDLSMKPEELEGRAIDEFGLTDDPKEGGFLLKSGLMLDFSSVREGGRGGDRVKDHGEISMAYEDYDDAGLGDFIGEAGAVSMSVMDEQINLRVGSSPTPQQMDVIMGAVKNKNVYIDHVKPLDGGYTNVKSFESDAFDDNRNQKIRAFLDNV